MGALLGTFVRVALQVLAGVGIGHVVDKVAADKMPGYEKPMPDDIAPWSPGFKPIKLGLTVVVFALAALVIGFVAKKFHIRILK